MYFSTRINLANRQDLQRTGRVLSRSLARTLFANLLRVLFCIPTTAKKCKKIRAMLRHDTNFSYDCRNNHLLSITSTKLKVNSGLIHTPIALIRNKKRGITPRLLLFLGI